MGNKKVNTLTWAKFYAYLYYTHQFKSYPDFFV